MNLRRWFESVFRLGPRTAGLVPSVRGAVGEIDKTVPVLIAVILIACYVPAQRAASIEPKAALRYE